MNYKRLNECFMKQSPVLWHQEYWHVQVLNNVKKTATLRKGLTTHTVPFNEVHE